MALNKEVWLNQIREGFYPDDSFLQKLTNYDAFVENDKIHIASAGIDPKVLVNNTTYPIAVVDREDDDCVFELDKFETENTIIRRPDAIEYSYDKLESVIRQHRNTLRKAITAKATHAMAPQEDTPDTPLVTTTGAITGTRKRLTFADILALKERFDDADIPQDLRYLVLHPKHVTDLLLEDLTIFKDITNIKDGEPLKFAGFGCFSCSAMPTYQTEEKSCLKSNMEVWRPIPLQAWHFIPRRFSRRTGKYICTPPMMTPGNAPRLWDLISVRSFFPLEGRGLVLL